jgi:hypothetical protein
MTITFYDEKARDLNLTKGQEQGTRGQQQGQVVTTQVVRFKVGCLIFILIYVHRFLTLNREPWNFEPE